MARMDPKALHQEAKDRYWRDKNLPETRHLLERGIALATQIGDVSEQKAMNYNLASFCWPGWDEDGIAPTAEDIDVGEKAANENLRLAEELQQGDAPMANAWFMVGAYHLVRTRYAEADDAFANSMDASFRAGNTDHMLLGAGFRILAGQLTSGIVDVEAPCSHILAEGGEHGKMFADQLRAAAKVFAS